MRRICVILCLSLFASIIHAASMPVLFDVVGQSHASHLLEHDCHSKINVDIEKSHSTNHQAHHQCCLGVLANLTSTQYIQPDFSNHYIPSVPQLIVEADPSHIFKPPRQIS